MLARDRQDEARRVERANVIAARLTRLLVYGWVVLCGDAAGVAAIGGDRAGRKTARTAACFCSLISRCSALMSIFSSSMSAAAPRQSGSRFGVASAAAVVVVVVGAKRSNAAPRKEAEGAGKPTDALDDGIGPSRSSMLAGVTAAAADKAGTA